MVYNAASFEHMSTHSGTVTKSARAQAKAKKKAPYNQYDDLEQQGVKIQWGSPSDSSAIPDGSFDIVYDNNGKDMDACKPLIDAFKVSTAHLMP